MCKIDSIKVNLTSVTEIKDFVSCLSEGNNVNFTVIKTRKNVDGSIFKSYWCHHGAKRSKGAVVTTATAIFKPVSQSANGVRLISQFQWRMAGQPARFIPHVDCHVITILCLL